MQIIWEEFLKIVREEAGNQVVETWFKAASIESWDATSRTAHIRVPNQFVSSWIQEHYQDLMRTHLSRLLHIDNLSFAFSCGTPADLTRTIIPASTLAAQKKSNTEHAHELVTVKPTSQNLYPDVHKDAKRPRKKSSNINERYLFENFVVGNSNALGHAAAYAVSQHLGKVYNPLLIYGGTGLGKTHLMHAIGNEVKRLNPHAVICYETSDYFMTEFINAIRFDRHHQFREKYQKIDLLMLDDIQFLSNKEQTQEAFFHIFNRLYEQGKQIVMSADTFPKEITGLQDRLKSRMEWGLVVDVQSPDLETKIAILQRKAETHGIDLTHDVACFIASNVTSNIRELEGALIRVSAFSALTNQPVTVELAKRTLLHLHEQKKEGVMLATVLKQVSNYFNMSIAELKSKKRHKNVTSVRQIAFYLMKKLTFCSLQVIGEFMGGRDHSTVIHAVTKIESLFETDPQLASKIKVIEQEILRN